MWIHHSNKSQIFRYITNFTFDRHPGISLCAWTLAFQCLTLAANQLRANEWTASVIVEDRNFLNMLGRFLSGEGSTAVVNGAVGAAQCGPMACQSLNQMLVRLLAQSENEQTELPVRGLKQLLLQLLLQLVSPGGALALKQGPLDAQCKFLEFLLKLNFEQVELPMVVNYLEAVGENNINYMHNYKFYTFICRYSLIKFI
jgi:baculoviral IAP repeat-containing protein 6